MKAAVLISISFACCGAAQSQHVDLPPTPSDAGTHARIVAAMPKGKATFFFGVPRGPIAISDEVRASPTVKIREFQFYARPWSNGIADHLSEVLLDAFSRPALHRERPAITIPKACGGFHPDIALIIEHAKSKFELLICLSCAEWRATAGDIVYHSDVDHSFIGLLRLTHAYIFDRYQKEANKSPEPTTTAVTPPAAQESRRP